MEKAEIQSLIRAAFEGQKFAYVPYSRFHVGAALLGKNGTVYKGCNIENAGYTPTNCAERTALFKAVSEGERDFAALAVTGGPAGKPGVFCAPCGVCRQMLSEFCTPEMPVILGAVGKLQVYTLGDLLPLAFGPRDVLPDHA